MNKFINFFKLNLPIKKIGYFFIITVIIFTFSRFIYFQSHSYMKNQNIYDLIISMFSNQLVIAYFLFVAYFIFIYNIGSKKQFYKYVITRFRSLKQWYNNNILIIFIFSIIFIVFILIICFLESYLTLSFHNEWSEYSLFLTSENSPNIIFDKNMFKYIISSISPLKYSLINSLYIIFYFFNIGSIFFILSIILKNKIGAFVGIFIINCINIIAYNSEEYIIRKFSFYNNIILLGENNVKISKYLIYEPLLYWIIISIVIYIIGRVVISKVDFKFGDNL